MARIPLYATETDLADIVAWLSRDPEIAFIVSIGPKRWAARPTLDGVHFTRIALWHVLSGPLPLAPGRAWQRERWIEHPERGWKERRAGPDATVPYFGEPCGGVIWFDAVIGGPGGEEIGISSFEWDRGCDAGEDPALGSPAERWWGRLEAYVGSIGVRVPRAGPLDGPGPEVWALAEAYARLRAGATRAAMP